MNHRRQKSARLEKEAKYYIELQNEYYELRLRQRQAPLVELEKPFVRGYERFFILKDSTLRRKDAKQITEALSYFQNHEYCRKGWFRGGCPIKKRWIKGKVGTHFLCRPRLGTLIKVGFPNHLFKYVTVRFPRHSFDSHRNRGLNQEERNRRARFQYPGLLTSRTRARLITHLRLRDPALEARLDEIIDILRGNAHYGKISKALHRRKWRNCGLSPDEQSIREDFRHQLHEANSDPSIKSAVFPVLFYFLPSAVLK